MLDRLEKLDKAATPGPWFAHNTDDSWFMNAYAVTTSKSEPELDCEPAKPDPSVVAVTLLQQPNVVCHESTQWHEDAVLIAAARNALPALLAVARAAEGLAEAERQQRIVKTPSGDFGGDFEACGRWIANRDLDLKRAAINVRAALAKLKEADNG